MLPVLFFLPVLAFAVDTSLFVNCNGTTVPCTFTNLIFMVNAILKWFIMIAGSLAAIGMMYSGARMLVNSENAEERTKAKNMFKSILIGVLYVAGAWLIVYTIMNTLTSGNGNFLRFFNL